MLSDFFFLTSFIFVKLGKKATPICLPLPGGFTRFCGRVYGISRKGDQFKACLGLDLRAEDEVEASLRVSCFNFGPRGVEVAPSEPIPQVPKEEDEDEDDDDILGIGGIGGGGILSFLDGFF